MVRREETGGDKRRQGGDTRKREKSNFNIISEKVFPVAGLALVPKG